MDFAKAAKNAAVYGKSPDATYTENGMVAYNTTGDKVLDLFSTLGAMRGNDVKAIENKFLASFYSAPELTLKMLFYCGDIREGLGERDTFRIGLHILAKEEPNFIIKNIPNIPYFNRWDSCFALIDTPVEEAMWSYLSQTLIEDLTNAVNSKPISLLAKWMPSINASSKKTKKLAVKCIDNLIKDYDEKKYRKMLSYLRKYLKITERYMSEGEWDSIDYEQVPSLAMKNYRNAFLDHDDKRFKEYLQSVSKGEKKINASTLYPYNIVQEYISSDFFGRFYDDIWGIRTFISKDTDSSVVERNQSLELQWQNLPNYIDGNNNVLVMCDVSGSMFVQNGLPVATSVGLGIYFAERNNGPFKNLIMTFSSNPSFICLNEKANLYEKIKEVFMKELGFSTNLKKGFDLILSTAIHNQISPEDMPKALVVISDMEIDKITNNPLEFDFIQSMEENFNNYGYSLPKLVLWNVESRHNTVLTKNSNVILVSGHSPSVFQTFLNHLNYSAEEIMLNTLNNPRYDRIIVNNI